jgi:Ca2+-binding RTX toxin-like protein
MTVYYRNVLRYDSGTGAFAVRMLLVEDDDANFNSSGLDPGPAAIATIDPGTAQPFETLTSGHILTVNLSGGGSQNISCIRYNNPEDGFSYFVPIGSFDVSTVTAVTAYIAGATAVFATPYSDYGLAAALATGTGNDDFIAVGETADALNGGDGNDTIYGLGGNDTIDGGFGSDTMFGGAGTDTLSYASVGGLPGFAGVTVSLAVATSAGDTYFGFENLTGSNGDDTLTGDSVDNTINGSGGHDTLNGGIGADTLLGGSGNDVIIGGAGGDTLDGGTHDLASLTPGDTVSYQTSSAGVTINGNTVSGGDAQGDTISNFEHVIGTSQADNITWNVSDGVAYGLAGDDTLTTSSTSRLEGGAGADTLIGIGPGITIAGYFNSPSGVTVNLALGTASGGDAAGDSFTNIRGVDGSNHNDVLTGTNLTDRLSGGNGTDTIEGGAGADNLNGGVGTDGVSYASSDAGVTVNLITQTASGGHAQGDLIASFEAVAGSEHDDILTARADFSVALQTFIGSSIVGNGGNDLIQASEGEDFLNGGNGIDTISYSTSTAGVTINLSNNTATGGYAFTDVISNFESVIGSAFADTLSGTSGDNTLDGSGGVDSMTGGLGNDTYVLDNASDTTVEAANAGIDTTRTSITHALRVNIENLVLTGNTNINGTGNTLDNDVTGNSGSNVLNGLTGADDMVGLAGNDTYWVENAGDTVTEAFNQGIDIVQSYINFTLSADIEKLYLRPGAFNGTGNAISNFIYGNNAVNLIDGQGGADRLYGYDGNDTYIVDSAGDLIFEVSAAGGTDTVQSSVNHTLATNVENLTLTAGTNVNGTGNTLANVIVGGSGNNFIDGKLGSDTLTGGSGGDQFVFTTALGAANIDTIIDFNVANDFLRLDDTIFTGLTAGAYLAASQFTIGAAATTAAHRIVYNSATGALFFDADGSGAGAAKQFASLGTGLALTASDVYVF